jgi:hypothetical protein
LQRLLLVVEVGGIELTITHIIDDAVVLVERMRLALTNPILASRSSTFRMGLLLVS